MKILTASLLLAAVPAGSALSTDYKAERALRFEIETELKLETTTMEIERDGERTDAPSGGSSHVRRKEVHVDHVIEVKDGQPTKVRRAFESVGGKSEVEFGEQTRESDIESPLEGVTLEIVRGEGKVESSAVEGGSPPAKSLEGHRTEAFLDALLPEGEVKADETWDLDTDAVRRALRLDVSGALYPPPERAEGGGEEGGGGRRRGGMRGMGGDAGLLSRAEWKGTAKLVSLDHDLAGTPCAEIEVKLEASGDLPEPERGGGRGERAYEPESLAFPAATSTYQIALEGKFLFAVKARRPVSLELEGTARLERQNEMKRGESTMRIHVVQEGAVSIKVEVAEAAHEEK